MDQTQLSVSTEAITFQKRSLFFNDVIMAIHRLKESNDISTAGLAETGLDEIVKRHTGLFVETEITSAFGQDFNAFAHPPIIDTNSPFFNFITDLGHGEVLVGESISERKLKAYREKLTATLDRKKSRVGGLYSAVPLKVALGRSLVKELTAEQVAAIYLHEVGHLFTFFEILVDTLSTNLAIAAASEALAGTSSHSQRVEIIHCYERATNSKVQDAEALAAETMPAAGYQAILVREYGERVSRASNDAFIYDLRNSEFAADHFASMHGAGKDLVMALDAMYTKFGISTRRSKLTWFAVQLAGVIFVALSVALIPFAPHLVLVPVALILMLFSSTVEHNLYDEPTARVQRVRNNLVQAVKDLNPDAADRKTVLKDIEFVDKLLEGMVDRRSLLNMIWISLTPGRRRQYNQIKFQKELESAINNNIFVSASKLTQLTSQGA